MGQYFQDWMCPKLTLDENFTKYTTIYASKGLFKYNCLGFRISNASGIFQRAMEKLFNDLSNITCYLDYILVIGKYLNSVFQRMQTAGLKLRNLTNLVTQSGLYCLVLLCIVFCV